MTAMPAEPTPPAPRDRRVLLAAAVVAAGLVAAFLLGRWSASGPRPVLTGTAVSGTIWKYPLGSNSNEGTGIKDHHVEVYEHFIVARQTQDGREVRHYRPNGYFSDLAIK